MEANTAGLTEAIRTAIAAAHKASPSATVRRLTDGDIPAIRRAVKATIAAATPADETAIITAVGGYVAGSYKYRPFTDRVLVEFDIKTGSITACGVRETASSRPHGIGDTIIGRCRKPGQTQGRIVYKG